MYAYIFMIYKNIIYKIIPKDYTNEIQSGSFLPELIYSECMKGQNMTPKTPSKKTVTPHISLLYFIHNTKEACGNPYPGKKYCTKPQIIFPSTRSP